MTKQELNMLVERVISIRDNHREELRIDELDTLAEICNVVDHNIGKLAGEK